MVHTIHQIVFNKPEIMFAMSKLRLQNVQIVNKTSVISSWPVGLTAIPL